MLHAPPSQSRDPDGRPPPAGRFADPANQASDPAPAPADAPADPGDGPRRSQAASPTAALFDEIAPVYDRLSRIASLGRDGRWRAAIVTATGVRPGDAVIDVASGTGRLAAALADRVGPFGRVVAVDLSPAMVERGTDATRDIVQLEFVLGDARSLPFDDARFDAATVAFGLASIGDLPAALAEVRRVVRPGGSVVCLERTVPRPWWWGRIYGATVRHLAPLAGRAVGGGSIYGRISEARLAPPPMRELVGAMEAAGLVDVTSRRLWLGSVALVRGVRPGR